ncbi:MAG: hypothetical protein QXW00_02945 [Candidatus Woesearchaeota archaeon]
MKRRSEIAWDTIIKFIIIAAAVFVAIIIARALLYGGLKNVLNFTVGD